MAALSDRMELLASALRAQCPHRIVTRDLRTFDDRSEAHLQQGVFTIVSIGEDALKNNPGREAHYGQHRLVVIGQIYAGVDSAPGSRVEDAEHAMVDDLKAFCRRPPPEGIDTLVMNSWRGSGQVDAPYGSVVVDLEMLGE